MSVLTNIVAALVVPHAGTWIEIPFALRIGGVSAVVPHAGTWIEMPYHHLISGYKTSFPTRERGLK